MNGSLTRRLRSIATSSAGIFARVNAAKQLQKLQFQSERTWSDRIKEATIARPEPPVSFPAPSALLQANIPLQIVRQAFDRLMIGFQNTA